MKSIQIENGAKVDNAVKSVKQGEQRWLCSALALGILIARI